MPASSYGRMTGTSMATPHVAGGAALFYLYEQAQGHGRPTTRDTSCCFTAATTTTGDRPELTGRSAGARNSTRTG